MAVKLDMKSRSLSLTTTETSCDFRDKLLLKEELLEKIGEKNQQLYDANKDLEIRNKNLQDSVLKLKQELDTALSRLSKIAGQKMSEGNPAITDLGNPNRPGKIAEKWSTLYTDEWTDLYEVISNSIPFKDDINEADDGEVEKQIMKIVEWCYQKCMAIRKHQTEEVNKMLWDVVRMIHCLGLDISTPVNNNRIKGGLSISSNTLLHAMEPFKEVVNESQNHCSSTLMTTLKQKCVDDYMESQTNSSESEILFVEKCCELCWYMCITEPPMVIEYRNFENTPMDTNIFNQYNRTGSVVEYVVWPALLLHENGPVLSKGTAQVHSDPSKQKKSKISVDPGDSCLQQDTGGTTETPVCPSDSSSKEQLKQNALDKIKYKESVHKPSVETNEERDTKDCRVSDSSLTDTAWPPPSVCGGISNKDGKEDEKKYDPTEYQTDITSETMPVNNAPVAITDKNPMHSGIKPIETCNNSSSCNSKELRDIEFISTENEDFDPQWCDPTYIQHNRHKTNEKSFSNATETLEADESEIYTDRPVDTTIKVKAKTSGTTYYIKREIPIDKPPKHTGDTLKRTLNKCLLKSQLPRQYSVDLDKRSQKKALSDRQHSVS